VLVTNEKRHKKLDSISVRVLLCEKSKNIFAFRILQVASARLSYSLLQDSVQARFIVASSLLAYVFNEHVYYANRQNDF
jgi:hypothetical protein